MKNFIYDETFITKLKEAIKFANEYYNKQYGKRIYTL